MPDDVLLNITGDSVARVCQVPYGVLPARVNQHVAIIRPEQEILNPSYLAYYLASPYMQSFMLLQANGKGASRNALTKEMIGEFEIPLPSTEEQSRIVEKLKPYDKLIENNRKQIALLEEAARRLYKEWFIDLRFPDYENSSVTDGVPAGWTLASVAEYAEIVKGCSYTSANIDTANGVPMINLASIASWGGYKPGTERNYSGKFRTEQVLERNDVVMAMTEQTAGLAGYVARIPRHVKGSVPSMDLVCLRPKDGSRAFLYGACRYGDVSRLLSPLANGTKIKHLKPEALGYTRMLVPPKELQFLYEQAVSSLFGCIDVLAEQNTGLQAARNLLIPKLIHSESEVCQW